MKSLTLILLIVICCGCDKHNTSIIDKIDSRELTVSKSDSINEFILRYPDNRKLIVYYTSNGLKSCRELQGKNVARSLYRKEGKINEISSYSYNYLSGRWFCDYTKFYKEGVTDTSRSQMISFEDWKVFKKGERAEIKINNIFLRNGVEVYMIYGCFDSQFNYTNTQAVVKNIGFSAEITLCLNTDNLGHQKLPVVFANVKDLKNGGHQVRAVPIMINYYVNDSELLTFNSVEYHNKLEELIENGGIDTLPLPLTQVTVRKVK